MIRVLTSRTAFERAKSVLSGFDKAVSWELMEDDGTFASDPPGSASPASGAEVAWFTGDIFFGNHTGTFVERLRSETTLRWVQVGSAGADYPLFKELTEKGALITTSHGQAPAMAEYVLAGVFDVFQQGGERRQLQQQRQWKRVKFREIAGSRWLIVGMGSIGTEIASRATALGAICKGIASKARTGPGDIEIMGPDRTLELARGCDVVVLCCPLTEATRHLADRPFFQALDHNAVFVNVGRGALVDEAAMLEALETGHLVHAVLDVFETEPLAADSPFWSHSRVSLTAHAAGHSTGLNVRNDLAFADNLRRYQAGQDLAHVALGRLTETT